jgi:hypothetical protein
MKSTIFITAIFGILLFSCAGVKSISGEEESEKNIQWGMRWSKLEKTDTSYLHAQGIDVQYDCFPSEEFLSKDRASRMVSIYNRWGELLYNSRESQESWICNTNDNSENYNVGTYFYILIEPSLTDLNLIDTVQGQLTLYRK